MPALIRPFRDSDLPAIQEITIEGFAPVTLERNLEEAFGEIAGHDWRWRKARHIEQDAERDRDGIFVAEADGQIVGYITTWSDRAAGVGFIPNLAVRREHQGAGLGRRLIERALEHFRALGLTHARIETLAQNPIGQHLYPACGFVEIGWQIHYGIDLRADA